ncbi:MAG: Asp-tRNA(Asn)/Glu-tRNA(Gln) amidotransferase subunit GatC, partial [Epsilonproteobacteria bacterium]|nr:Asp-tRNA(Asn)/Glu-tRNA(Gln) amidotransferase subunit GatC [Campylobacterota bacterium]
DDALLAKLSKLSNLSIDETKKEDLKKELSDIVNFVENLNDIDVSHIDATFTTLSGGTTLREDVVVSNAELVQGILNNAPQKDGRFFVVPKIIE